MTHCAHGAVHVKMTSNSRRSYRMSHIYVDSVRTTMNAGDIKEER